MHTSVPMCLCSTLHVRKLASQVQDLSSFICHSARSKRTNRKGDSLDPLVTFYKGKKSMQANTNINLYVEISILGVEYFKKKIISQNPIHLSPAETSIAAQWKLDYFLINGISVNNCTLISATYNLFSLGSISLLEDKGLRKFSSCRISQQFFFLIRTFRVVICIISSSFS